MEFLRRERRVTVLESALDNPWAPLSVTGELLRGPLAGRRDSPAVQRAFRRLEAGGSREDVAGLEGRLLAVPPAVLAEELRAGVPLEGVAESAGMPGVPALSGELEHGRVSVEDARTILLSFAAEGQAPNVLGGEDDPEWVDMVKEATLLAVRNGFRKVRVSQLWWRAARMVSERRLRLQWKGLGVEAVQEWSVAQPLNAEELREFLQSGQDIQEGSVVLAELSAEVLRVCAEATAGPVGDVELVQAPGVDPVSAVADFLEDVPAGDIPEELPRIMWSAFEWLEPAPGDAAQLGPMDDAVVARVGDAVVASLRKGWTVWLRRGGPFGAHSALEKAVDEKVVEYFSVAPLSELRALDNMGTLSEHPGVSAALFERLGREEHDPANSGLAVAALQGTPIALSPHWLTAQGLDALMRVLATAGPRALEIKSGYRLAKLGRDKLAKDVLPLWFEGFPKLAPWAARTLSTQKGLLLPSVVGGQLRGEALAELFWSCSGAAGRQEVMRFVEQRLGADPHRWEMFATLLDGWEGTLPELLTLVVGLHSPK